VYVHTRPSALAHAMPRSRVAASNWVTQTPTRSPLVHEATGARNTWMDFTFLSTLNSGRWRVCPTARAPCSTVPVRTVPCPLIAKQWSTYIRNCS